MRLGSGFRGPPEGCCSSGRSEVGAGVSAASSPRWPLSTRGPGTARTWPALRDSATTTVACMQCRLCCLSAGAASAFSLCRTVLSHQGSASAPWGGGGSVRDPPPGLLKGQPYGCECTPGASLLQAHSPSHQFTIVCLLVSCGISNWAGKLGILDHSCSELQAPGAVSGLRYGDSSGCQASLDSLKHECVCRRPPPRETKIAPMCCPPA